MKKEDDLFQRLKKSVDTKRGPWRKQSCRKVIGPPKKRKKPLCPTSKKDLESTVQKEIVAKARELGIRLWRQQAGLVLLGSGAIRLAPAGAADLTGILPDGCRLEVEVKRRFGGVQLPDQKIWQKFIETNNGIYILAHSPEEFERKILPVRALHWQDSPTELI